MKEIKLIHSPKGWFAKFIGDNDIINAFGTDTIPTPFTQSAYPLEVLRTIERLNPDYKVSFNV